MTVTVNKRNDLAVQKYNTNTILCILLFYKLLQYVHTSEEEVY